MAKSKKKKTKPNRQPATMADVNRAKKQAALESSLKATAVFVSVLYDKEGYTPDDLQRVWGHILDRFDAIEKGYANVNDYIHTMQVEGGIRIGIEKGASNNGKQQ